MTTILPGDTFCVATPAGLRHVGQGGHGLLAQAGGAVPFAVSGLLAVNVAARLGRRARGPYNSPLMALVCLPSGQSKLLEVEERIYKKPFRFVRAW